MLFDSPTNPWLWICVISCGFKLVLGQISEANTATLSGGTIVVAVIGFLALLVRTISDDLRDRRAHSAIVTEKDEKLETQRDKIEAMLIEIKELSLRCLVAERETESLKMGVWTRQQHCEARGCRFATSVPVPSPVRLAHPFEPNLESQDSHE